MKRKKLLSILMALFMILTNVLNPQLIQTIFAETEEDQTEDVEDQKEDEEVDVHDLEGNEDADDGDEKEQENPESDNIEDNDDEESEDTDDVDSAEESTDGNKDPPTEEDEDSADEADETDNNEQENDEDIDEENENIQTFANEPKEITENIIDEIILKRKGGEIYEEGDQLDPNEDLELGLEWSLPEDPEYVGGDTFTFKLPEQLAIHSEINGDLDDYGTFEVTTDGEVTFTFNEKINENSNVKGTFWVKTELDKQEIKTSTEELEIIFNDDVAKKITVDIKPENGQAIHKEGQPVGGDFNAEEIEWTVLVNTTKDKLENTIVNDPILEGQELDLDSIELTEIEVDLSGKKVEDLGKVEDFTNDSTDEELNLKLGDTNKAYELTFKTKIKEDEKDKEGSTTYENTAHLTSDGKEDKSSGASVSVNRPKSMKKTSSDFNTGDRSIKWTVNANFNEKKLEAGNKITDEFTFEVDGEKIDDVFKITEDDISIEQVDEFSDDGSAKETSKVDENLFDIDINGNEVTFTLNEETSKAFVIKYKTKAEDGTIINKDGTIENKVDLNGKTDESSVGVVQQVGKKTHAAIDYDKKEITWEITVNADKQDLKNFILTDDFSGSGQKLKEDSVEINPGKDSAVITPADDKESFEINFGDIEDTYVITYKTEYVYDFKGEKTPIFKNGVDITYETSDGSEYELEFGDQVTPNDETKNNGVKNGKVNNETKEITWTVDINYNQLKLTNAKVIDEIPDNQLLIDDSVKIFETTIGSDGKVHANKDVTDDFTVKSEENLVKVDFTEEITQSYRVEFMTKDKDDIYNKNEVYKNTAQFIPRKGEEHSLKANVTLPNQGEFLGKSGRHNKDDWTVDWTIDVNESRSTLTDVTVKDNLGDDKSQILLEDSFKVTEKGSGKEVDEETYELTIEDNSFSIHFPGEMTEAYEVTYSSYILAEETADIKNEAEISSVEDISKNEVEKTDTVEVKISTGGGTAEGATGNLTLEKTEKDTNRALEDIQFTLIKKVGDQEIIVREGRTDEDGKLEWTGLKYGDYTLEEDIPEGYKGRASQKITINNDTLNDDGILTLKDEIVNERETGTAKIIKVDSATDDLLKGAEFTLINQTTDAVYNFETNDDGVIEKDVPFGEYTVEEIKAPEGYRITTEIPDMSIEIDETTTITVENTAYVDITGEKTWFVDEETELQAITVELYRDGTKVASQKVSQDNDWKYEFENQDKYNQANREIKYEIKEVELDGYISEEKDYDLTNIQTIDIPVTKTWLDDDDATEDRPNSITVQVLDGEEVVAEEKIAGNDWDYTFTNLPKYNNDGELIDYTVQEKEVDGYATKVDGYDITNLRKNEISVSGEKTWLDEKPTDRPEFIEIELTRKINDEPDADFKETKVVRPNSSRKWLYEFNHLDEFDENGIKYTYVVTENNVPSEYESTVDGYDVTNVRIGKTEVTGTKRWKDDKTNERPDKVVVNLLQNDVVVDTKDVTADDKWSYTFDNLEKYDKNGKYYEYTVSEHDVPGYESKVDKYDITNTRSEQRDIEITKGWLDGDSENRPESVIVYLNQNDERIDTAEVKAEDDWKHTFTDLEAFDENGEAYNYTVEEKPVEGYKTTIDGFNITNLRVGKTEISGSKVWQDAKNVDGNRPDSITVNLLQNGKIHEAKEVTPNDDGDWKYSFEELEKYDNKGVEWGYTIDEKPVKGYEKSLEDNNLVNTRVGTTEVSGKKTWQDADNVEGSRPDSITVNLLQNGKIHDVQTVTAEDEWTYNFDHLPKYDSKGREWGYTIDEEPVEGYAKALEGDDLINTRVGETDISGTKVWQDGDSEDRPEEITVNLLRNGEIHDVQTVTEEDDWTYSFTHLPKYDSKGREWGYTIDEERVEGYAKALEGNDLINTRIGETEVSGEKIWQDADNLDDSRPDSITVNLLRNGEIHDVQTVTAEDDWAYSFSHLPKYDSKGREWGYTIDEEPVKGYEKSLDGNDLINTRVGETEVSGTKIWKDGDSENRPEEITVNLLQNGEIHDVQTVTAEDEWAYSFTHLPKYDSKGREWGYTIDEEPVEGYAKSLEGNDLVNTRIGQTEVIVTKSWQDDEDKTGDRPDSIKVNLWQNGELYTVEEIQANGDWEHTFSYLPKYDSEGELNEYTITEHDVPGYETSIDGFDITNTRSDEKSIEITKSWLDDNSKSRPESIEVELFRSIDDKDKESIGVYEVTSENDWVLKVDDLAAFDSNGKAYVYEIEEKEVTGYNAEISGFDIVNTRQGTTAIDVQKKWDDNNSDNRPDSITINLFQNGKKISSNKLTEKSDWKYTFVDLPQFDSNSKVYEYTIEEDEVDGYTSEITGDMAKGFTVTNTEIPDEPEEPEKPEDSEKDEEKDDDSELPKTGETTYVWLAISLILIGLGAGFVKEVRKEE